jgi:hypothetical protein
MLERKARSGPAQEHTRGGVSSANRGIADDASRRAGFTMQRAFQIASSEASPQAHGTTQDADSGEIHGNRRMT